MKINDEHNLCSIIVPVFNSGTTLNSCLEGLARQYLKNGTYEIIVADDGSTDNSLEIAQRYDVKILKSEVRTGAYAARNRGITNASGSILVFTDATCYPCADWLNNLISRFEETGVGCVAGQILSAPPLNLVQRFSKDTETHDMNDNLKREFPSFVCGNVAIKREVFEHTGLFDESLESGGDGDLAFRVKLTGIFRIVYEPSACVYYNYRNTLRGLLGQAYKYGRGIARFRLNYYGLPGANKPISLFHNLAALIFQLATVVVIPLKIPREYKRTESLISAFAYPSIDKLHTICFHIGILMGLIIYRHYKRPPFSKLTLNS